MHRSTRLVSFVLSLALSGLFANAGCSTSSNGSPDRKSQKGEACQTTADCSGALSCVPRPNASGGICVTGEFKVQPTAKECAVVQCAQPTDCCPTPSPSCSTYQQGCMQGVQSDCTYYNEYCKCDGSKFSCNSGTCRAVCSTNTDCGAGTCMNGQCVQCTNDSGCSNQTGYVCNSGVCEPPCRSDSDCPSFNTCDGNGHCVDSGCQTDRECIAETKNVTATCKSGTCVVPCDTDLECGNPDAYNFYSCISHQCVYVGCDSDKECELYLGQQGTPTKGQIVCRDKATAQ